MEHGCAIVELMGHRRVVGRVSETEIAGAKMIRVETLSTPPAVQCVHPQALYAITPCNEEQALRAGRYTVSPLCALQALPANITYVEPDNQEEEEEEEGDWTERKLERAMNALELLARHGVEKGQEVRWAQNIVEGIERDIDGVEAEDNRCTSCGASPRWGEKHEEGCAFASAKTNPPAEGE